MQIIYLLRHGEIAIHSPRRFVGQTELALAEPGWDQMRWAVGRLKDTGIDRLVASPLGRRRESAGILGAVLGLSPDIEPALREIALGAWEGMTVAEVRKRFPGSYEARGREIAIFRPPAGESLTDLSDRVWPAFLRILHGPAENIAIVGHAGVNRVLLCRLLGMPLSLLSRLPRSVWTRGAQCRPRRTAIPKSPSRMAPASTLLMASTVQVRIGR